MNEILEYTKEFCRFSGLLVVLAGVFGLLVLFVEVAG